jgi:uncharacterized membrane protein HdeD (DUF308 family)
MTSESEQIRAAALAVRTRLNDKLGDVWWSLLARGLLALALGFAALFWPKATLVLLIRLIAVYALVDGALGLISAFRAHDLRSNLAPGLVSIAVGLILLFWPGLSGRLLLIIVGLWALLQGAMLILAAIQTDADDPDRAPAMTIGAIAAVIGLILAIWPGTGAVTIAWAIGIAALLIGASLIYLALRLRKIDRRVENLRPRRQ